MLVPRLCQAVEAHPGVLLVHADEVRPAVEACLVVAPESLSAVRCPARVRVLLDVAVVEAFVVGFSPRRLRKSLLPALGGSEEGFTCELMMLLSVNFIISVLQVYSNCQVTSIENGLPFALLLIDWLIHLIDFHTYL